SRDVHLRVEARLGGFAPRGRAKIGLGDGFAPAEPHRMDGVGGVHILRRIWTRLRAGRRGEAIFPESRILLRIFPPHPVPQRGTVAAWRHRRSAAVRDGRRGAGGPERQYHAAALADRPAEQRTNGSLRLRERGAVLRGAGKGPEDSLQPASFSI